MAEVAAGLTAPGRAAAEALVRMRATAPLVQCITNYVAMNFAANVVIAAGGAPAMVHATEEAGEFAALASALTVNIGTLSPPWVEGMRAAAAGARAAGVPWVLDPVAAGATAYRREVAAELLGLRPTVLRGNASEILALAGEGGAGRGVDAGDEVAAAEDAARVLAQRYGCLVAVTGATDFVTDGTRALRIVGGHSLMPKVTAMGCALTAVVGGFIAGADDAMGAVAGALALFAVAGEAAGANAAGPGSFQVAFLDTLPSVAPDDLALAGRVVPA